MKLIFLTGAPSSGKDTAAKFIEQGSGLATDQLVVFERLSMPHKVAFAAMMNVECDDHGIVQDYEQNKEKPIPLLGVSYRQWQIDFSEKFMKPLYGQSVFSKLLLSRLDDYTVFNPDIVVIPDCGFQVEVDTIVNEFPAEDIALLRILRPGFTFEGDSREHVEPCGGMFFREIHNNGNLAEYETAIRLAVQDFLTGVKS